MNYKERDKLNYSDRLIDAITTAMKKRKITGKMIEEYTGVSHTTISMWKKGYQPKFDNALKVMQYLHIDMADILDIVGKSEQEMRLLIAQNYVIEIRDTYKRLVERAINVLKNDRLQDVHKLFVIENLIWENNSHLIFYSEDDVITGQYLDQFIPDGFRDFSTELPVDNNMIAKADEFSENSVTPDDIDGLESIEKGDKMWIYYSDGDIRLENVEFAYNLEKNGITLWAILKNGSIKALNFKKGERMMIQLDDGSIGLEHIENIYKTLSDGTKESITMLGLSGDGSYIHTILSIKPPKNDNLKGGH